MNHISPETLIHQLALQPHPEGGFYKEVYRSQEHVEDACLPASFTGRRNFCTSIYYLLKEGDYSMFHRIKSDELWHFYQGGSMLIHVLHTSGDYECLCLGSDWETGAQFQCVVPAGAWFAAEPAPHSPFALVGCTVSPGFDFQDLEMANKDTLLQIYPNHTSVIERLTR